MTTIPMTTVMMYGDIANFLCLWIMEHIKIFFFFQICEHREMSSLHHHPGSSGVHRPCQQLWAGHSHRTCQAHHYQVGDVKIIDSRPILQKVYELNSLSAGRCISNFENIISDHTLQINFMSISCEIALRWIPANLTNGKSTLVQVIAWCRQATSHYLSQCWPRSLLPYGVIRPQWVNSYLYWFQWLHKLYLACHHTSTAHHPEW